MIALIRFALAVLASPFKSKRRLEAENAVLRHQLIVVQRKVRGRAQANCTSLALAERLCRTVDRIDPAQVLGPHHCLRRGASAPGSKIIRRLLQSCFITRICLCDWGEEVLLIWMRSRGVIWVLPRAMNDALSRRFAER